MSAKELISNNAKDQHIFFKVFQYIMQIFTWMNHKFISIKLLNLWEAEEEECSSIQIWSKEWEEINLHITETSCVPSEDCKDKDLPKDVDLSIYLNKVHNNLQTEMYNQINKVNKMLKNPKDKIRRWTEFNLISKTQMELSQTSTRDYLRSCKI